MAARLEGSKVATLVHEKGQVEHDEHTQAVVNAVRLADDVANTKYNPWTKAIFRLYGCLTIAYLCGCLNGYDGSLMGRLNAMTSYQRFFSYVGFIVYILLSCC